MLRVGDVAPEIDLPASDGTQFRLSERRGRYVVVYFYPRAFTPGCTRESMRFRDNSADLAALGAEIVGVSTDGLARQCDFASSLRVTFPLLSDEDGRVSAAYRVLWNALNVARRVTYVIGPEGYIEAVFWHEVQVSKHLDDVVGFFASLRAAAAASK